ncbi:hypothetical protein ACOJBM_42455 [Rhizobium beringeri]|nr:hypothetical protein [Rhizobium leguminosarum]
MAPSANIGPDAAICPGHCRKSGVVTLSFSGWKGQRLVDIQATQAAIFHASKASSRWRRIVCAATELN